MAPRKLENLNKITCKYFQAGLSQWFRSNALCVRHIWHLHCEISLFTLCVHNTLNSIVYGRKIRTTTNYVFRFPLKIYYHLRLQAEPWNHDGGVSDESAQTEVNISYPLRLFNKIQNWDKLKAENSQTTCLMKTL